MPKEKEKEKLYSVTSKSERFRKSGIEFSKVPTILKESELAEAIKNEPMFSITLVKSETEKEK